MCTVMVSLLLLHPLCILHSALMKGRIVELLMRCHIELILDLTVYMMIGFMPLSEHFHLKMRKWHKAYWIGAFPCKQEAIQ